MRARMRKVVIVVGIMSVALISSLSGAMTSYAAGPSGEHAIEFTQSVINSYKKDSVKSLGSWEQQSDGSWMFKQHGGTILTNSWIESLTESEAYYFVGDDGRMIVNGETPDGRKTDSDGLWREVKAYSSSQVKATRGAEPNQAEYTSSDEYYRDLANWLLSEPGCKEEISRLTTGQKDVTLN